MGRTVPTVKAASLLFYDGKSFLFCSEWITILSGSQCFLDIPIDEPVAAGIVLTNRNDIIVNCFGFRDTWIKNDCILWKKINASWCDPVPVKTKKSIQSFFDALWRENHHYWIYPTFTYCQVISKFLLINVTISISDRKTWLCLFLGFQTFNKGCIDREWGFV